MMKFDFDVAIIGGGSGGYAAAKITANAGMKTVVIEGGKEVGGLCILRGCMPTKGPALYGGGCAHGEACRTPLASTPGKVTFDFKKAMARKRLVR